jgi:hypothetical protein
LSTRADATLGLGAVALGALYFAQAAAIEDSLLSDAIGAGGVPMGIAALIMGAGTVLTARAVWDMLARRHQQIAFAHATDSAAHRHKKALGLLALLLGYVLLLPHLGYATTILILAIAIAAYAGAPLRPSLLLFGAGTAVVLWAAFVGLLRVPLPAGALFN